MAEEQERVWREGNDILVRGRKGQANLSILTLLGLGFGLFVFAPIALAIKEAIVGDVRYDPTLGDSPMHFIGWGAVLLLCLFLGVVTARLTFIRHALGWKTMRIQFTPDAVEAGKARFLYAKIKSVQPTYTTGLRGLLAVLMLIVMPLDALARVLLGWLMPAAFEPLNSRSLCIQIDSVWLRTFLAHETNVVALAQEVAGEVARRKPAGS